MAQMKGLWRNHFTRVFVLATLLTMTLGFVGLPFSQASVSAHAATNGSCLIHSAKGNLQHVIYVQFDNTHFTRDNPNVPSDLEQMPHLLNFIKGNGVLLTNHHTPLISHTPTDATYNMLSAASPAPKGTNAPAPWVPYTRAGCNVGSVATANTILENIGVDVPTVFGSPSPEATEVATNPGQAFADFVGIGIHCAAGNAVCNTPNARPDVLPNEPGGYSGFTGLFGNKYVAPVISPPNGPVTALKGNVIEDTANPPHVGFPGFDGMSAAVSLGYVAAMQEHGVPVTYAYISDAHDNHTLATAYGPGEA